MLKVKYNFQANFEVTEEEHLIDSRKEAQYLLISWNKMRLFLYISICLLALCPSNKAEGLNEGQACGCDMEFEKCLGKCSQGLWCKYEEESLGHGTCAKPEREIMVSFGDGFCAKGYYAGWDGKGVNSQDECNDLCLDEPECTYASFFGVKDWKHGNLNGNTCSRYNGQSCNLFCEKPGDVCNQFLFDNSKTFKKTIKTIA